MENSRKENPNFKPMILFCRDCSSDFLLTPSEQLFFWRKALANPTRCPACRRNRRGAESGERHG